VLKERNSLYGERTCGYLLSGEQWVNIDTPEDLDRAAAVLGAAQA
jgi:choline kinase